jgi:hypothetical protein
VPETMSPQQVAKLEIMNIPSFFRGESEVELRQQVRWLQEELHLSDQFFLNLLGADKRTFIAWKSREGHLFKHQSDCLRELWAAVLHILSSFDFDLELAHRVFEYETEKHEEPVCSPFVPPWNGTSMKAYLEANGFDGVTRLNHWWQYLRFGNSF